MRSPFNPLVRLGITSWLCLLPCSPSVAQEGGVRWGDIPRPDLEMTRFPADSNATAVVLADVGQVTFPSLFEMVFVQHRRIKILSEAGYGWGTVVIPFYAGRNIQSVTDVKGQTFHLAGDGSAQRVPLDKKSVFTEEVDREWRRIRLTLPALSPGCVVEYSYKMVSRNPSFLHDWAFQTAEPTLWSELRVEIPDMLQYVMVFPEGLKFDVDESETFFWQSTGAFKGTRRRWAMRNVRALREEPYMTTPEDFLARIRFQLSKVIFPGAPAREFMTSWGKLAEELMNSEGFGRQIERHGALREQAEALTSGLDDPERKMRALYDYARRTMTWNGKYGLYVEQPLDRAFRTRRASGPEIALTLTALLRFAGLEAHPVLISTRNHGRILTAYPLLTQFDYVLTYVKVKDREYLLDATDPLRPCDLLPERSLNHVGWLVDRENPSWVNIAPAGAFVNRTSVFAELTPDGSISGWFESHDAGYSGLIDRHLLRDKKEDDYVRDGWLSGLTGARLDSFQIHNRDSTDAPLVTRAYFSTADHAQVIGDNIYFNPIFFGRRKENPFKRPERTFPVDFAYGRQMDYTLNLALPQGYALQDTLKNLRIALPRQGGHFVRLVEVSENTLQVTSQFVLRQSQFEPKDYRALREFHDQVVAAQAEQIALKRVAGPGGGGSR